MGLRDGQDKAGRMGLRRGVAAVLRASVTSSAAADALHHFRRRDLEGLAAGADFHGISGYVHDTVHELPNVPADELEALRELREDTVLAHLHTLADLRHVSNVLGSAGAPWIVIKGPVLAERVHEGPHLRPYSDLDVVVHGRWFGTAIEALEAHGCTVLDRNWLLVAEHMLGEVRVRLPTGATLDLHWHLLNQQGLRRTFPIRMADLFERACTVDVSGHRVPTLCPTDTIVYVALHTMLSGGHRLIWLKDLERLLLLEDTTDADIDRRATEWNAGLLVATAVQRVAGAIGLPEGRHALLRSARARAWLAATSLVWSLSPAERQDGSGSLGRIVARATRAGSGDSGREFARRALSRAREGPTGTDPAERPIRDARDPRSSDYRAGGAKARAQFLEAVSAASR